MPDLEFIAHTKRKGMTKARAAKIFLARNGICYNCGKQIRQGDLWFIEHPESLAQGGSDNDADLWPSHNKCKATKDAKDASSKAKRDRLVTKGWEGSSKSRKIQSQGFPKPKHKYSAARGRVVER